MPVRRTDMTQLTIAFRRFGKALKIWLIVKENEAYEKHEILHV